MKIKKTPKRCGGIKKCINTNLDGVFNDFSETLKATSFNLDIFYKNVEDVKLESVTKEGMHDAVLVAAYESFDNKIRYIAKEYLEAIMHEIFHMSTRILTNKTLYLGFMQYDIETGEAIGIGLCEAYTSILDERYFGDYTETKREEFKYVYQVSRFIVSSVECVLGEENMEKLYSECDLYTLTKTLARYTSLKRTTKFYRALDYITLEYESKKRHFATRHLIECLNYTLYYVIELMLSYMNEVYLSGQIDLETYNDAVNSICSQFEKPIELKTLIKCKSRKIKYDEAIQMNEKIRKRKVS